MQPGTPTSRFLNARNIKTFGLRKGGPSAIKRRKNADPYPTQQS